MAHWPRLSYHDTSAKSVADDFGDLVNCENALLVALAQCFMISAATCDAFIMLKKSGERDESTNVDAVCDPTLFAGK